MAREVLSEEVIFEVRLKGKGGVSHTKQKQEIQPGGEKELDGRSVRAMVSGGGRTQSASLWQSIRILSAMAISLHFILSTMDTH